MLLESLSSGRLDEQSWEDMEDTLISADMGVGPARELVEELRTQVKVAGTSDPAEVRDLLRGDLIARSTRTWTGRCTWTGTVTGRRWS